MLRIYARLIGHFWRLCIARETHYRANFIALAWVAVVQTLMTILPMLLVYTWADEVSGWSRAESLAVVGLFQAALALHELVLSGGAYRLSPDIQNGDLDLILIRPVSAQFYVTFRYVSLPNLANAVIGVLVFAIGISRSGIVVSFAGSMQALVIFLCGLVLVSAVILGGNYIAFRATTVEGLSWMLQDLAEMGRYPIGFYPLVVRAFLTGIMPVAFVTVLPLDALRGAVGWGTCALAIAFAALAVALLRWWWGNSVRHYTSASS